MLNLAGEQGTTLANESVEAVRKVVDKEPAPPGVKAYVNGPAALSGRHARDRQRRAWPKITLFTLGPRSRSCCCMVYRSIRTTLIQLFLTLRRAGVVPRNRRRVLGLQQRRSLTTFAANILTMLAIAAATDYGIFLIGRYQERVPGRRGRGPRPPTTRPFKGVAPVVLGSGPTIAGATYCTSRASRGCPGSTPWRPPVAIGMIVVVLATLTLGPAVVFLGSRFGLFDRRRGSPVTTVAAGRHRGGALALTDSRGERGAARPGRHMVALPGFKPSYNDRHYLPESAPVQCSDTPRPTGIFRSPEANPDLLMMVDADHDMRNPADMLVLDRVAKNEIRTVGIAMIRATSPDPGNSDSAQLDSLSEQHSKARRRCRTQRAFRKTEYRTTILKMADTITISYLERNRHTRGHDTAGQHD